MTSPCSRDEFLQNLKDSGLLTVEELTTFLATLSDRDRASPQALAGRLIATGALTPFQAAAVSQRRVTELVMGNYLVLDRLGAGGMGTVYKARHRRMKRIVALKVLSPAVAQSPKFVQRFQREVEAVARLSHPNIVMAYDADEAEAGHFLVMEFIDGCDLATEVEERGPLPVPEALAAIVQAARALNYAHGQGIIHRDIKPANLLRDRSGVVKVADLGLARFNDAAGHAAEGAGGLTQAGTIMGTVDFMPPEQAMGLPNIDHRADIYSLGCTLFFLLTGRPPYAGATLMATLLQHREAAIPSLNAACPEASVALDRVFQRMVAKKPEERFASMADVAAALEALTAVPEPRTAALAQPARPERPDTGTLPAGNQTVELTAEPHPDSTHKTILLVEPSRSQALIIRGYLQKLGFENVVTAPSGEKALEVAHGSPPRAVISSLHLADMTGVQMAQRMRADRRFSSTGFVLITSQGDAQDANLLEQVGNAVQLTKPFDLPQLAHALSVATGDSSGEQASDAAKVPDDLRVLVVDDSAAARVHVRKVLAGLGLERITEAADGAEALTLLGKEAFDLVVTDYNMPYLDGRGLIDFIRHRSSVPSVPIIVVTTETDPGKLEAVRQLGVTAICDKSFRPEVVRGILARLR